MQAKKRTRSNGGENIKKSTTFAIIIWEMVGHS